MSENVPIEKLLFVFDANSGTAAAWVDSAKKILMLKGCSLCAITHGIAGEKDEWSNCKAEIGVPVEYLHRNEVDASITGLPGFAFPSIVAIAGGRSHVLVGPDVLDRCRGNVADLKSRLFIHALSKGLSLPGS